MEMAVFKLFDAAVSYKRCKESWHLNKKAEIEPLRLP